MTEEEAREAADAYYAEGLGLPAAPMYTREQTINARLRVIEYVYPDLTPEQKADHRKAIEDALDRPPFPCCGEMADATRYPGISPVQRRVDGSGWDVRNDALVLWGIVHCPWCGAKLPD